MNRILEADHCSVGRQRRRENNDGVEAAAGQLRPVTTGAGAAACGGGGGVAVAYGGGAATACGGGVRAAAAYGVRRRWREAKPYRLCGRLWRCGSEWERSERITF
jgi:hypothetical protein